eukprot:TRINITY_DN20893_c0_g1_i1.p1 TRINITY_DN20893_c0_g1~~TRINITY_DN20893_c0_g1_i1.p1  ORF type:complete len:328 (+),score=112.38 TRINITY_DN20893_c0_g1_i1:72-1055(+)
MLRRIVQQARGAAPAAAGQVRTAARYVPEVEMRRPAMSSKHYRSVQDWKPMAHEVAHKAGQELTDVEETTMMHMILIDSMGYRWPVRFKLRPAMTLLDLFIDADPRWFEMLPDEWLAGGSGTPYASWRAMFYNHPMGTCEPGHPQIFRCTNCMIYLPYEYLDAMAPPNPHEVNWMRLISQRFGTDIQANARMACQVYIEDWMDGMTCVLPQKDSVAYQMYYQHGVDKASQDEGMVFHSPHSPAPFQSDGYLTPKHGAEKSDKLGFREGVLDWDTQYDRGDLTTTTPELNFGYYGEVPLREVFWMSNVDDVIRTRDPNWKGYYEFLKK